MFVKERTVFGDYLTHALSDSPRIFSERTACSTMDDTEGSGDVKAVQKDVIDADQVLAHHAIEPTVVSALLVSNILAWSILFLTTLILSEFELTKRSLS